jgi:diguanylate cyclase (GGDEF)-like protein/PAS domain S-box-containing protein
MFKQYHMLRALRFAIVALFLAIGVEGLKQVVFHSLSNWHSHIAAILLCASIVFFLSMELLSPEQPRQEFFQGIIGDLPEIAYILDEAGRFKQWNSTFQAALGYTAQEIARITVLDTIAEEQRVTVQQTTATALADGMAKVESVLMSKDGTCIPCLLTGIRVLLDDQPCVLGIAVDLRKRRQAGILSDIPERKAAEEALQKLASIVEFSQDAIIEKNMDGVITSWNRAAEKLYGYTPAEAVGRDLSFLLPLERQAEIRAIVERVQSGSPIECLETQRLTKDGSLIDVSLSISPIRDASGRVTGAWAIARDITHRKHAEEQSILQSAALEAAANAIVITDHEGTIVWVNRAFTTMTGYSKEEVLGKNPRVLKSGEQSESYYANLWSTISSGEVWKGEIVNRRKDGTTYTEEMTITPITRDAGNPANRYFIAIKQDVTQRKAAEERVQFLAYYDALTGLPNRTLLQDRLAKALAGARRQKDKVALLFLDLDRFKDINDSLGHSLGDLFLQEVAERLKSWGREQDTVARLSGDEFLIVLTRIKDVPDAAIAAERFMDTMTAEFVVQGHSLSIGCSVGISIYPEHGVDVETLIKNADAAMYSAKESGRNNFRFFTDDMNAQVVERLTLESGLRLALDKKELFLVYQPQMDIATGKITGLEALLRWQHPELGLVPPDKFIRIAENSGLILPIGEWVVRTACQQARKWQDEGLSAVSVAVNVSAVQFRQENFCELIRGVLHETGLAPRHLELELTESLLLANADVTFSVLQELKALGLTLAIDDFGTGYSSFSYLRQFRVNKLKIDRSFVRDVAVNRDDAAITTAIISMAKSLNLKVIAEGVENEAQMSFLRAHHCDEIQGYYFSKPLAVDKIADKLRGGYPEPLVRAQASGGQSSQGTL